jgi:sugar lactone lactonase YvrE
MLVTMYRLFELMNNIGQVTRIDPSAAIAGGEVALEYQPVPAGVTHDLEFEFAGERAQISAAGKARALVLVPDVAPASSIKISTIVDGSEVSSAAHNLVMGQKLASGLHPVTNPAFDPSDGSLFVTRSGSRGEHVPISIFRITSDGAVEDYSSDVMNPTSIAFDRTNRMFVTSRFDGTVFRITGAGQVVSFATDLGIATGLAFNQAGEMFVGDRTGTIHRVNEIGEAKPWAEHEPSVSAYHLAVGPDDNLYVTGPTVSSFDSVTRFDESGVASTFYRGLGRPQGIAFDRDGNLYVAASLRGRRGVVRISPDGARAELVVAGMNVVGLAFGLSGEMVVATNDAVYELAMGIQGLL